MVGSVVDNMQSFLRETRATSFDFIFFSILAIPYLKEITELKLQLYLKVIKIWSAES